MCQYSSSDGFANDWHLVHAGSRAIGGAGLVILEATAVAKEGRITPGDLGIYKEDHIAFLKRITSFIREHGSVPGIQLAHAGRKASCRVPWRGGKQIALEEEGWEVQGPSPEPFYPGDRPSHALSVDEIAGVIRQFREGATRAVEAGFGVIELHAAHGYLLHQFYSPLSNRRTDAYGGTLKNRCRFLLEVVRSVREVLPDGFPLFVRISATDWTENGWQPEDSVVLAGWLKEEGVDLADCSSGGNVKTRIPVEPGYQVPFAARIRAEAGIATGAVGFITEAAQAEKIIGEGKADIVLIARQMLRDPYFPLHAAQVLEADVAWPVQYERAG